VRIAVVDTYYPVFLEEHYRVRPELAARTYREQLAALIDRCFGTADAYSRHLNELGHEAIDVVANCAPLQLRWAAERRGPGRLRRMVARAPLIRRALARDPVLQEIAIAQIEAQRSEVVYVQNLSFFNRANLDLLRGQGRLLVGQISSEPPADEQLRGFDLLLSSFPHFVERFRALGVDSEFLQIGFYERVLDRLRDRRIDPGPEAQRPHALSFVGGIDPRYSQHRAGAELLERVAAELPLEVWGYGAEGLAADSALRRAYRGEAWGIDMYGVLARSRIVVNRHGPIAAGYANNMRLFEATGAGAMLITEAAPNLADYFEPGHEVVTYDGPADLMEKLRHYLEHDEERKRIAAAGQARSLRDHSYGKVIARLSEILEARLS
jgi:glycosyltransferase involved in cell wall biosynthesis